MDQTDGSTGVDLDDYITSTVNRMYGSERAFSDILHTYARRRS